MRKFFITLLAFLAINQSFAYFEDNAQGSCSFHGGIDCASGFDWDGSVICNDGWRESSEGYFGAQMCSGYPIIKCTTKEESEAVDARSKITDKEREILTLAEAFTKAEAVINENPWLSEASRIGDLGRLEQDYIQEYEYLSWELESLTRKAYPSCVFAQEYERRQKNNETAEADYKNRLQQLKESILPPTCGTNQYLGSDNACYCESGYLLSKDKEACITPTKSCQELNGAYSYSASSPNDDGSWDCFCQNGYQYNGFSKLCEKIISDLPVSNIPEKPTAKNQSVESETTISDAGKSQFKNSIISLKEKGIINGYEDGTFKPFNPINRAEFMKIVIGATFPKNIIEACVSTHFSDITSEAWFNNYVCIGKTRGIINGYSDGSFKPEQQVNVAEALKITLKAFGIETRAANNDEAWFAPFVEYARNNNYYLDTFDSDGKQLTREDMAELVYRLMPAE